MHNHGRRLSLPISLASLFIGPSSWAQSSVMLFGVVDISVNHYQTKSVLPAGLPWWSLAAPASISQGTTKLASGARVDFHADVTPHFRGRLTHPYPERTAGPVHRCAEALDDQKVGIERGNPRSGSVTQFSDDSRRSAIADDSRNSQPHMTALDRR